MRLEYCFAVTSSCKTNFKHHDLLYLGVNLQQVGAGPLFVILFEFYEFGVPSLPVLKALKYRDRP